MIEKTVTNDRPTDWSSELHRMRQDRPEQNFRTLSDDELVAWVQQLTLTGSVAEMRTRFVKRVDRNESAQLQKELNALITALGADDVPSALKRIESLKNAATAQAA